MGVCAQVQGQELVGFWEKALIELLLG